MTKLKYLLRPKPSSTVTAPLTPEERANRQVHSQELWRAWMSVRRDGNAWPCCWPMQSVMQQAFIEGWDTTPREFATFCGKRYGPHFCCYCGVSLDKSFNPANRFKKRPVLYLRRLAVRFITKPHKQLHYTIARTESGGPWHYTD